MTSLRISGGTLRGRIVAVPPHELRPTSNKARQAFFNMLGPSIAGARFLDLFAGSGIFSFEAMSRGASRAVAVDSSASSCASIREVAAKLDLKVNVIQRDALQALREPSAALEAAFDVIYADPPYDWPAYRELLESLDSRVTAPEVTVAIEHRSDALLFDDAPLRNLTHRKTSRYGTVAISIFDRRAGIDETQNAFEAEALESE